MLALTLSITDNLKTEVERLEEEAMISELVELVKERDRLLWELDENKTRYVREQYINMDFSVQSNYNEGWSHGIL